MKRSLVLVTLVIAGLLSIAVGAIQGPPPSPVPSAGALAIEKVRDNLYVIRGAGPAFVGGNTAVFIQQNGVVLVDTKVKGFGQPLIEKVKTITNKPITTIINTHAHFDHVGGNVEFPPNVQIVTQENTAGLMKQANAVWGIQNGPQENLFKKNNGRGLPTKTFKTQTSLGSGNDRIELRYFGRAHTGGDAFVIFPALKIAHVGDVFANKGLPIMDRNNGGAGVAYADTVDNAARGLAAMNVEALINGHTPAQTTLADLREYGSFVRDFTSAVREAKASGKTLEQFVAGWKTPAKYAGYAAASAWDEVK
jgi:glyoxylase-like metal-dependent hydrolase (beta-lactamase superfamily II)